MKISQGKLSLIFLFLFIGCNPCDKFNASDFGKDIKRYEEIKNSILTKDEIITDKSLNINSIKNYISKDNFVLLKKMNFIEVRNIDEVLVFKFGFNKKNNILEKKINESLDEINNDIGCQYYLFFHKNSQLRKRISFYEQYSDCRIKFKDFENDWSLVINYKDCNN